MDTMLRQRDLMAIMNISRATLWRMLKHQNFPKPVVMMGCKRWRRGDLELWLEARKSA
jgi:predicted DNA-binding transcriptional regulator AlpA